MKQVVTRIEDEQYEKFKELTASLGTTSADALRMFVHSFNDYGGFPYPVRRMTYVPFETEEEVTEFMDEMAMEVLNEAW